MRREREKNINIYIYIYIYYTHIQREEKDNEGEKEQRDSIVIASERGKFSFKLGEEFAGSEKLGLAPTILQNLWGSAELLFKVFFLLLVFTGAFRRIFLQHPTGSAEFWRVAGPVFEVRRLSLSPKIREGR